jgi:mitogen-activated protein kinase kinase kinase
MLDTERVNLVELLKNVDCLEYLTLFEEHDITPDLIPSLDKEALKEIGVTKVGDRLRLQVLVYLTRLERIKKEIPIKLLNTSINVAVNSIIKYDEFVKNNTFDKNNNTSESDIVTTGVIIQNGKQFDVFVDKNLTGNDIKKTILINIVGDVNNEDWKLYYIDYQSSGIVHEVDETELMKIINNNSVEKDRLILCKFNETVSVDAINVSNKIKIRNSNAFLPNEREIKPFMGGRPPSQLISTNLREYFPDLDNMELEDIKRKSTRMSIYSNKIIDQMNKTKNRFTLSSNRDSLYSRISNISLSSGRLSMISTASYGVGVPLKINHHDKERETESTITKNNENIDNTIVDEHPHSIIELLDESDDEENDADLMVDALEAQDEAELMSIIDEEVTNGPSVWHKGPKIGQGSFGNVYLGLNGLTGELMAIKQVDMPKNETEKSKKMMVNALKQEISLLKELSHENIVRYLGSNEDISNMYIFLEYIPGGSVSSMLKMYGPFEDELVRNFTKQVLVGLVYLHSKGIIHRDIKGGNILVDNNGSVKIGDFGISKKISKEEAEEEQKDKDNDNDKKKKRASLQGSVFWMAPEVVKQVAYTEKADVWSVGCLVVEMYTGKHPYPALSPMQAIFQIGTGKAKPTVPERATASTTEFLSHVFTVNYLNRWTAKKLLGLEFVQV